MATAKNSTAAEALAIRRKIIGVLLQGARQRSGKSRKDCADTVGVSSAVYSKFEDGAKDVSLPQLELLAYALNVSTASFFKDKDQEKLVAEEPTLPAAEMMTLRNRIIGVLLRQARTEAGKSRKELAAQLAVSPRRINQYEYGQRAVPVAELQQIADYLRVPMSYFVDEGVGRVGQREQLQSQFERFSELPDDVRAFVSKYTNLPYLRVAIRIAGMDADRIRGIAEGLLDITY